MEFFFLFIIILVHYSFHAQLTSQVTSYDGGGPIVFTDVTFNLGGAYSSDTGNVRLTPIEYIIKRTQLLLFKPSQQLFHSI